MKWWMFFLLLSGIFFSPRTNETVAMSLGIFYMLLAIVAGLRDE